MADKSGAINPFDPRSLSHAFGMELSRLLHEADMPQGQQQRGREVKREVHVISETEYILTETTREFETFSFVTDFFQTYKGSDERGQR